MVNHRNAVRGKHDRFVLLIPTDAVVLVTGASENLDNLASPGGPSVDPVGLEPVTDLRINFAVFSSHGYLHSSQEPIKAPHGRADIRRRYAYACGPLRMYSPEASTVPAERLSANSA